MFRFLRTRRRGGACQGSLTVAAGMGTSWIGDWWTAEENDSSLAHRARRRTSFSRVFEDCGLRILSLRCHRDQYHGKVVLCLLVNLLVLLLRRGPTAEVVSQTRDDVTGLRAPVRCQLEAAAQDAADEPSFGSGSLSASLLRGASMRNHGISCCYATMERGT